VLTLLSQRDSNENRAATDWIGRWTRGKVCGNYRIPLFYSVKSDGQLRVRRDGRMKV
jgi:hypothetical protein